MFMNEVYLTLLFSSNTNIFNDSPCINNSVQLLKTADVIAVIYSTEIYSNANNPLLFTL